ncbi:helix-turn-helix transcriptional regulator [Limnobacter sp.]|uniref:helix-turn-helix transcriptional regulator n=1 Tax=Limnobacter sp. TaxID=2003368 RepID=UPI003512C1C2
MPKKSMPAMAVPAGVHDLIMTWGQAVRAHRLLQRLTTAQLASRVGVSLPTLSRIEKGDPAVAVGSYLSALFALGLQSTATPALPPELWQAPSKQRTRPSRQESGDDLGYF